MDTHLFFKDLAENHRLEISSKEGSTWPNKEGINRELGGTRRQESTQFPPTRGADPRFAADHDNNALA
jgi:hypothetical protein